MNADLHRREQLLTFHAQIICALVWPNVNQTNADSIWFTMHTTLIGSHLHFDLYADLIPLAVTLH